MTVRTCLALSSALIFCVGAARAEGAKPSTSSPAASQSERQDEDDDADYEAPEALSHRGQFGLRVGFVFGYAINYRYDSSPYCQESDYALPARATDPNARPVEKHSVCGFGAPPALELALSFAPFGAVEPFVFTRLGLAHAPETFTSAARMVGAGARIYAMHDTRFKLFVEPAIGVALEGAKDPGRVDAFFLSSLTPRPVTNDSWKTDFVFHVGIGPQYDFVRYFGVFASGNVDVGVLRSLSTTLSAHVGVQGRYP